MKSMSARDEVDRIVEAWRRERPELNVEPLQVLSRVSRLARHLDLARKQAFATSALESWEFDVLSALRRAGHPYELSPKALLQQTLVSSGTMTNRIDRLTSRGLVERRTDLKDGRSIRVQMTDDGRVRVDRAIDQLVVNEAALLQRLSADEQQRLAGLLRTLGADFDDTGSTDSANNTSDTGDGMAL
jgi:DNA-binding MarR family transcriptional regulator